jgi:hypothetical protein
VIIVVKNINFPSINITLDEIRLMYNLERDRFQRIENKTNSLMALNAIIFTIISIISLEVIFLPTMIFLLISIFYSFKIFKLRDSEMPHFIKNYEDFLGYAKQKNKETARQFILDYMKPSNILRKINLKKTYYLEKIYSYSILAWVSFIIAIILKNYLNTFIILISIQKG